MSIVRRFYGPEHFKLSELVDIGWRLSAEKLGEMGLLAAVVAAEKEALTLVENVIESLNPLTEVLPDAHRELESMRMQLKDPQRGQAVVEDDLSYSEGRTLPVPGTILQRYHEYQSLRMVKKPCGKEERKYIDCFRFLVVEQPAHLLWLDEPKGMIYGSPSGAVFAATRSSVNGWSYFGIEWGA